MLEVKEFTPELLIFLLGIVQSLFFEYVPKVESWFAKLNEKMKRLVQAGVLLVLTLGIFGLACGEIIGGVACSTDGLIGVFVVYFFALMANQTTHSIFKRSSS